MADDEQTGNLKTWLAAVQEDLKASKPNDKASEEEISRFFGKWTVAVTPGEDATKSRMLDSPEKELQYAVNQLTRKPDGTTVVRYYFSNDDAEVNGFCRGNATQQSECTPLDDNARKLAREAMQDIVTQSGAKIEFDEVFSLQQADITLVRSPKLIDDGSSPAAGYAGRSGGRNYIVDATSEAIAGYRQLIEGELTKLSLDQKENLHRALLERYGEKDGKRVDIPTILISKLEKTMFAHEIEHILGAKHPDAPGGVRVTMDNNADDFNQSIMGGASGIAQKLSIGKTLGQLDIKWYQRHFGVRDLAEGALQAPSPIQTDKLGQTREH